MRSELIEKYYSKFFEEKKVRENLKFFSQPRNCYADIEFLNRNYENTPPYPPSEKPLSIDEDLTPPKELNNLIEEAKMEYTETNYFTFGVQS